MNMKPAWIPIQYEIELKFILIILNKIPNRNKVNAASYEIKLNKLLNTWKSSVNPVYQTRFSSIISGIFKKWKTE
mgnify:CR=1 FL=1